MKSVADESIASASENHFEVPRKVLEHLRSIVEALEPSSLQDNPMDGLFCFELALKFYEEANIAVQAGAWFAAAAVASSALEATLLSKSFFEAHKIRELPKFQNLKQSYKADFNLFARSLDLGKLLEIANELGWFSDGGLPETFKAKFIQSLDEPIRAEFLAIFESEPNIGRICAGHLREYRNLLHPAVCLKERRQPSVIAGQSATLLFLIAFTSLTGG